MAHSYPLVGPVSRLLPAGRRRTSPIRWFATATG